MAEQDKSGIEGLLGSTNEPIAGAPGGDEDNADFAARHGDVNIIDEVQARKQRIAQLAAKRQQPSAGVTSNALEGSGFDTSMMADSVRLALEEGELHVDTNVGQFRGDKPIHVDPESKRPLWAVYMTRGEHNLKLMLKGEKGRTRIIQFTNNVLFVHTREERDAIEEQLGNTGEAFDIAIVRCTLDQALHLVALQKQAQKSVTQSGALSTPFIRASEGVLASAMAAAKGALFTGERAGTGSFGV